MTRLIDADKAIVATWIQPTYTDPLNVLTEVRDRIRELPTVDAVPVRHGKWIRKNTGDEYYDYCSECRYIEWNAPKNYCPNCGADMRGEEE